MNVNTGAGPLHGLRVVELAAMGPVPFAGMVLCDLGAEVLRVDRLRPETSAGDVMGRGRRSVSVDLKHPDGVEAVLRLVETADVLLEGFRPGVVERLGIGPDECLARNPGLVYGRMTGWGQDGPYAQAAGHDINYVALSGALYPIGRAGEPPVAPLSYVGDFGGGGMLLVVGVLAALHERQRSGLGQVVDAAMVDGAALLSTFLYGARATGTWSDERGTNLLDTGAPFYETYETADGRFVTVGAIEPQFWAELVGRLGVADELPEQYDRSRWPEAKARLAALFRTRTRAEWCELLEGTDACFAPVLSPAEVADHPHHRARGSFVEVGSVVQPAPAPRFGRTPTAVPSPPPVPGAHADEALTAWGFTEAEVEKLRGAGAVA